MSVEENVMAFCRICELGFGKGDLDILDELVDENLIQHEPGVGNGNGLAVIKERVRVLHAAFEDLSATVEDCFGTDDRVCARVTWRGTQTGAFAGLPATQRTAVWEGIDIARFDGGKVVEHWGQLDRLGLMQQLRSE